MEIKTNGLDLQKPILALHQPLPKNGSGKGESTLCILSGWIPALQKMTVLLLLTRPKELYLPDEGPVCPVDLRLSDTAGGRVYTRPEPACVWPESAPHSVVACH